MLSAFCISYFAVGKQLDFSAYSLSEWHSFSHCQGTLWKFLFLGCTEETRFSETPLKITFTTTRTASCKRSPSERENTSHRRGSLVKPPTCSVWWGLWEAAGRQQALLPQGRSPHKGHIYRLLRSHHLHPMPCFQRKVSRRPVFQSPASPVLLELLLGRRESLSQVKAAQRAAVTRDQTRAGNWLAQAQEYRKLAPNPPCLTSRLLVLCQAQHVWTSASPPGH